jgi:hypothetical protein
MGKHILQLRSIFKIIIPVLCLIPNAYAGKWIPFADTGKMNFSINSHPKPEMKKKDSGKKGIKIEYDIPGAFITDVEREGSKYQYLTIDGFEKTNEVGKPAMPQRTYFFAIPPKAKPKIRILESKSKSIKGFRVHPALEPQLDYKGARKPKFIVDTQFYCRHKLYPESPVSIVDVRKIRGVEIAMVRLTPVQFNPADSELLMYSHLAFELNFEDAAGDISPSTQTLQTTLSNIVANPAVLNETQNTDIQTDPGLLIVTTEMFKAAADSLAMWKRRMGYRVFVIAPSNWTGSDEVKTTIHQYASLNNIDFFSIIGDNDQVPSEYLKTGPFPHVTDLYYACLDGSGDFTPDLGYGRISVSSPDQALNVVHKIIEYERNPVNDPAFYRNGTVASYFQESESSSGYEMCRFVQTSCEIRNYLIRQGYSIDQVFYTEPNVSPLFWNDGLYGTGGAIPDSLRKPACSWDGDASDISNGINEGRFLVIHRDHGNEFMWGNPAYSQSDIQSLSNGNRLPVVFSMNCLTGRFDYPYEVFAETFLRQQNGGAVGVVAATQISYSGFNDGLAVGLVDAIWPAPGLACFYPYNGNSVVTPHDTILQMGLVLNQGKMRMSETWGGWNYNLEQYTYEIFHYFGDPTMRLRTTLPLTISATCDSVLRLGQETFALSNVSCGSGMATIMFEGQIIARGNISGGNASLRINPVASVTGNALLTITAPNCRPLVRELKVIQAGGAIFVRSPTAGDTFDIGETVPITWVTYDTVSNVQLQYSIDGGKSFNAIVLSIPNTGSYNWTAPAVQSSNCVIRISKAGSNSLCDTSQVFQITELSAISGSITPATSANVYISSGTVFRRVVSDSLGAYNFARLVPGSYQLYAQAGNYGTDTVSISVPPDTVVNLTVRYPAITVFPSAVLKTLTAGSSAIDSIKIANTAKGILRYKITTAYSKVATKVLINEVCNSLDFIELWNQGDEADISGWAVQWIDNMGSSGSYQFPQGTVVASGKCILIKENSGTDNDSAFYLGYNLAWDQTTELSVALVDRNGTGIDFMRTVGSTSIPPSGTVWNGAGIVHSGYTIYRIRNEDNDNASDWSNDNVLTQYALNPGQSKILMKPVWLNAVSDSDYLGSNSNATVLLKIDSKGMVAGLYHDTLLISHNAPSTISPLYLPVSMTVLGTKLLIPSCTILNFDNVWAGTESSLPLRLLNNGSDTTTVSSITIDNALFTGSAVLPLKVPPFDSVTVPIRFRPVATGTQTGVCTIVSNADNGSSQNIKLTATVVSAPGISFSPTNLNTTLAAGSRTTINFTIENSGGDKLRFEMGATGKIGNTTLINEVCSDPDFIELWNPGPDQNLSGWKVVWNDNSSTSGYFIFPSTTILWAGARIVLREGSGTNNDSTVYIGNNLGWTSSTELSVALIDSGGSGMDFMRTAADNSEPPKGTSWSSSGIVRTNDDIYRIHNEDNNNTGDWSDTATPSEYSLNPGQSFEQPLSPWLLFSPSSDSVSAGAKQNIQIVIDASRIPSGFYSDTLLITHNDPSNVDPYRLPLTISVTSAKKLEVTPANLTFGTKWIGTDSTSYILLKNSGSDTTTVYSITSNNVDFHYNQTVPFAIPPFSSNTIAVTFSPKTESSENCTLTITSNSDSPILAITASGQGSRGPAISVGPGYIRNVITSGDSAKVSLSICNSGGSALSYSIGGQDTSKESKYTWVDSDNPNGPVFEWNDICSTGIPISLNDDDYKAVPLNFAFPFYGNSYSTMYISSNGLVSFGTGTTVRTNKPIPSSGTPKNFIAAFWDDLNPATGGSVYYKNSGSTTIVQFNHVPSLYCKSPNDFTFQIVLSANGNICLYYQKMYAAGLNSATVGIENADGTSGLQVVYNAPYIHDNLAVLFKKDSPWLLNSNASGTIAPGGCNDNTMLLRSSGLASGEYLQNLLISHNDPGKISPIAVPCTLIVVDSTIPVVSFNKTSLLVNKNVDTVVLQVSLSKAISLDLHVPFSITGSALDNVDYLISPSPLLIPAGKTSAQIVVKVLDGSEHKGDKTIATHLGVPELGVVGTASVCTLTILDDEPKLTITSGGCGQTVPSGDTIAHTGDNIAIKAIANNGCFFDSWVIVSGTLNIDNPYAEETWIHPLNVSTTLKAQFVPGGAIELVNLDSLAEVYLYASSGYYGKHVLTGPGIIPAVKPGNQIVAVRKAGKRTAFIPLKVISGVTVRDTVSLRDPVPLTFSEKAAFKVGQMPITTGNTSSAVYEDIDGDGERDLLMLLENGTLKIYSSKAGELTSAVDFATGIPNSTCIRIADWNGDGFPDILISSLKGVIYCLLGMGGASFADTQVVFDCKSNCSGFDMDEINGDGLVDFIIGHPDGTITFASSDNEKWIFSDGKLKDGTLINAGENVAPLSIDLNGDGLNDLVVGTAGGSVEWYLNYGDGTFVSEGPVVANGSGLRLEGAAKISQTCIDEGELPVLVLDDSSGNVWKVSGRLKGDFDNDGTVSFSDYLIFVNAWGLTENDPAWKWNINIALSPYRQIIDFDDFKYLLNTWGKTK